MTWSAAHLELFVRGFDLLDRAFNISAPGGASTPAAVLLPADLPELILPEAGAGNVVEFPDRRHTWRVNPDDEGAA